MSHRVLAPLLCLALAACGGGGAPSDREEASEPRQETVLDDLVEQKQAIPAEIDAAQRQHVDDMRRAIEAAEGGAAREGESTR
jgi:membrane peptidoglycan carboxypeptidase